MFLGKTYALALIKISIMKKIIIATDFSPAAENAIAYGSQMALAIKAELILLHVYQPPVAVFEVPFIIDVEAIKKDTTREINLLKERLQKETNNSIQIHTEEGMGLFYHELEKLCERVKPYAVIMGSQGTTASDRIFFGSETVRALKYLKWPLITIPPAAKFTSIKKIGLTCDLEKEIDEKILEEIKMLVEDFKAELHIINAGNAQEFKPDVVFESSVLERKLSSLNPKFHFITTDKIEEGIIDFAENNHIDLLITLPEHRSFLDLLIKSRVSKKIILRSHIPVIALHP